MAIGALEKQKGDISRADQNRIVAILENQGWIRAPRNWKGRSFVRPAHEKDLGRDMPHDDHDALSH